MNPSELTVDQRIKILANKPENYRNVMIIAHVDHGKTTLVDSLCSEGGLLNESLAGKQLLLDKARVEKERGITVYAGSISVPYKDYLVNIKDTPGHVEFSGEVDKGARAVDGAIVLIDAKEGVKTQSESVLALAIKQRKPMVLIVNKIDRLIRELNATPKEVYERLVAVLAQVNGVVSKFSNAAEYQGYFRFDKNVVMGSGLDRWMITTDLLRQKGLKFSDIIEKIRAKDPALRSEFPLSKIILDKVIEELPPPCIQQRSMMESLFGPEVTLPADLLNADPVGDMRALVCDTVFHKGGSLSAVRVLSGTLKRGDQVYSSSDQFNKASRVNKLMIDMTRNKIEVDTIPAGGIVLIPNMALVVGSTLSSVRNDPIVFPGINHIRQSVVSRALVCPSAKVNEILGALREMVLHDPTLHLDYDGGEVVLSGIGQLHLEIALTQLKEDYGITVETGAPSVAYCETVEQGFELKSKIARTPNGLNDLAITIVSLPPQVLSGLREETIERKQLCAALERFGLPKAIARTCEGRLINDSLYMNWTKGAEFMNVCREDIISALSNCLKRGPILGKPLKGLMVAVHFAKLHCDSKRRTELQFSKAFEEAFDDIFARSPATLMEPVMKLEADLPSEPARYMLNVMSQIERQGGVLQDTRQGDIPGHVHLEYTIPLIHTFGLNKKLMASCEGRIAITLSFKEYGPVSEAQLEALLAEKKNKLAS